MIRVMDLQQVHRSWPLLRGKIWWLVTALPAVLFFAATAFAADIAPRRPNILFCIADDWSGHAGALGDKVVRTPNIDRLAKQGVVFKNAFCAAPSCTPSRAAILTGRYPHQLEQGGNLWSFLPAKYKVFPDLLEQNGYAIGHTRKGWGPGNFRAGGRERNPAGPNFQNFTAFLDKLPADKPFFFWFGSQDPHRPYEKGSGKRASMPRATVVPPLKDESIKVHGTGTRAGLDPTKVEVPKCWPDTPEIREDILDYYFEVERYDHDIGDLLLQLESRGLLANTIIIVTSDNGMPFPRAKANLYDLGCNLPLIVSFPARFKATTVESLVSLADLAPTVLELADLKPLREMSARTFLPLLNGERQSDREHVFIERERHANVRAGDLSYPGRAIRTVDYLYIRNLRPDRWPAGDPQMHKAVGPYGDCDNSPSKTFFIENKDNAAIRSFFDLAFAKRPAEELYHLASDPGQTNNVVSAANHIVAKARLAKALDTWMRATGDPRVDPENDVWSTYDYFGDARPMPASEPAK
jgi:N-sulfoglucosamine sulfohydrolase